MRQFRRLLLTLTLLVPRVLYDGIWRIAFYFFGRSSGTLDEKTVDRDPFIQFTRWYDDAHLVHRPLPNAMSLSTSDRTGMSSARMVLLKEYSARGFVFYTNYNSRKAQDLDASGTASLLFYWPAMARQIRIDGTIEKTSAEESDRYFRSRPRESQIAAWASPQSDVVDAREELDKRYAKFHEQFNGKPVPRPSHWGGYRLKPTRYEFWQGRVARMHDRILFERDPSGAWQIRRLAP